MNTPPRPARRGRPPGFDRERALDIAFGLFLSQGYEGTSIANLIDAIGISPPSLYNAFGSKESLYREVIERYLAQGETPLARPPAEEPPARDAVRQLLAAAALGFPESPDRPGAGCLISTGLLGCAPGNADIAHEVANLRARARTSFQERFDRAVADGELSPATDTAALAAFYAATIQGMSVQAHDGANAQELQAIADLALWAWPGSGSRPAQRHGPGGKRHVTRGVPIPRRSRRTSGPGRAARRTARTSGQGERRS